MRARCAFLVLVFSIGPICFAQSDAAKKTDNLQTYSSDTEIKEYLNSPFLLAIAEGRTWLVREMLNRGKPVNVKPGSEQRHTPILLAILSDKKEILKLLIDRQANVDAADKNGITGLIISCAIQNSSSLKILIDAGANVNYQDDNTGVTPLFICVGQGKAQMVRKLLVHKADPNLLTKTGMTALMHASDDPEIVDALIESGAEIDAVDKRGWTALFYAIHEKRLKKLETLLKSGARFDCQDKSGVTPIELIRKQESPVDRETMTKILKTYSKPKE